MTPPLCLASASPRRRELLLQIGVPHSLACADIDETPRPGETPRGYVERMARSKASAIAQREPALAVLAADTCVVLDGCIYGKPRDREHGLQMLHSLAGRTHEVLTAVVLAHAQRTDLQLSISAVTFRPIKLSEAQAYWETGEPCDKAGGYAIQGLGAVFVTHLQGSFSGVMGLPLSQTAQLLRSAGLPVWCTMPQ